MESSPIFLETLEDRIAPVGDLIATITGLTLPTKTDVILPSEKGTVTFLLENASAADPEGGNDINATTGFHVYLSTNPTFEFGTDIKIGSLPNKKVDLDPGEKVTLKANFIMPDYYLGQNNTAAGSYYILIQADAPGFIPEGNNSNNVDATDSTIKYAHEFGQVGTRPNAKFTGYDINFDKFTLSLAGGGNGKLTTQLIGFTNHTDITLTGTTDKSILKSSLFGTLRNIVADSAMKSVFLPLASVQGDVTLPGGVDSLYLGTLGGSVGGATADITITGGAKPVSGIYLGQVNDLNIFSNVGIKTLSVLEWGTNNTDSITTPYLSTLKVIGVPSAGVDGDFKASLNLSGVGAPKGVTLGKATIAGDLVGGIWNITSGTVGDILAESAVGWKMDVGGAAGDIVLTGTSALAAVFSGDKSGGGFTVRASSFDKILVAGQVDAKIVATGADAKDQAIDSFIAGTVLGTFVQTAGGGIGLLNVDEWLGGGSISAKWVNEIKTDNKLASGNFEPDVTITGANPKGGLGLFKAIIKGTVKDAAWNVSEDAAAFGVYGIEGSTVNFSQNLLLLVASAKVPGYSFKTSNFTVAGKVSAVVVGDVDESGSGSTYGIVAGEIGSYVRNTANKPVVNLGKGDVFPGTIDSIAKYRAINNVPV